MTFLVLTFIVFFSFLFSYIFPIFQTCSSDFEWSNYVSVLAFMDKFRLHVFLFFNFRISL